VIPRPLQDAKLLEYIKALDAQFVSSGLPGSFGVRFHYAKGGQIHFIELEGARTRFVYLTEES